MNQRHLLQTQVTIADSTSIDNRFAEAERSNPRSRSLYADVFKPLAGTTVPASEVLGAITKGQAYFYNLQSELSPVQTMFARDFTEQMINDLPQIENLGSLIGADEQSAQTVNAALQTLSVENQQQKSSSSDFGCLIALS